MFIGSVPTVTEGRQEEGSGVVFPQSGLGSFLTERLSHFPGTSPDRVFSEGGSTFEGVWSRRRSARMEVRRHVPAEPTHVLLHRVSLRFRQDP